MSTEPVNPEVPDEDRLDEPQTQFSDEESVEGPTVEEGDEETAAHRRHDEELAEEWEDESFPASDPPSNY